jgi:hypothetical protein
MKVVEQQDSIELGGDAMALFSLEGEHGCKDGIAANAEAWHATS